MAQSGVVPGKAVEMTRLVKVMTYGAYTTMFPAYEVERVDATTDPGRCVIVFKSGRELAVLGDYRSVAQLVWGDGEESTQGD